MPDIPIIILLALGVPVNSVRQENEMVGIDFGKVELQISLFTHFIPTYLEIISKKMSIKMVNLFN